MALQIKKATRELIWTKIALMAASGGGKTYSALRLATGMREKLAEMGQETRIAMINSEQKRGYYYADEFDYDIVDVDSPYTPEKYVDLINEVVEAGYKILIVDSTSHEWEGKGGCLEIQQKAGGRYQDWAKVTPRHNKFIETIADSPVHIIATMRGKDQYTMEQNDKGRTTVSKVGVGAKQREGFEYEFTVTFTIDQKTSTAQTQKDNTHIFENDSSVQLSENHGKQIIEWANSGKGYTPPVRNRVEEPSTSDKVAEIQKEIVTKCKALGGSNNAELMEIVKKYDKAGNPNRIKDFGKLAELKKEIEGLKGEIE